MISDGYKGENIVFNAYVSLFIYFFNGVKTVFTRQAVTQGLKKKGGGARDRGGEPAVRRGHSPGPRQDPGCSPATQEGRGKQV